MDYYKCEKCGKVFDEFEMDYALACIDKRCLCRDCHKNRNSLLPTEVGFRKIVREK